MITAEEAINLAKEVTLAEEVIKDIKMAIIEQAECGGLDLKIVNLRGTPGPGKYVYNSLITPERVIEIISPELEQLGYTCHSKGLITWYSPRVPVPQQPEINMVEI